MAVAIEARVATASVEPAPSDVAPTAVATDPAPARPLDVDGEAERCFALYQQRDYLQAIGAATAAIAAARGDGHAAGIARLWSIVALARQALDEHHGARAALECAIRAAPVSERAGYERQLAALAGRVAERLVAPTDGGRGVTSADDVSALREALDWLERGAAATPDDPALRERAADVERRLWPAYERVAAALVQRQEYRAARALLREALDDPRVPPAPAATLRELFAGTYGGEIGQLTAQAIRSMQDARETDALGALARAEELLATLQAGALSPKRREEVDRRLWWGYKKLGRRRAQAGDYEAAADALGHALRFAGLGTDRHADTRAALARALEALVDARAPGIRALAEAGAREAALAQSGRLWQRLRRALDEGLSEDELAAAFAKAQRIGTDVGARL